MDSLAKRNYRSELRDLDWDFVGQRGSDGFAGFHWYPARQVPQVPAILLGYLSDVGERVLDPFCGSGTTLVEAKCLGRSGHGIDTNPVAVMMAEAKLGRYSADEFSAYSLELRKRIDTLLTEYGDLVPEKSPLVSTAPNAQENSRWYHPATLTELAAVWLAIQEVGSPYRNAAYSAFSSILRFACSQDKHWGWICDNVWPKNMLYRDAVKLFTAKLSEFGATAAAFADAEMRSDAHLSYRLDTGRCSDILRCEDDRSVDVVITSPPYYGVTDYVRSQRLTFLWLGGEFEQARQAETGARFKRRRKESLVDYLREMSESFREVARVLRPGRHCAIMIGESPRRIRYLDDFERLLSASGLTVEDRILRSLPRQRTMSPQLQTERLVLCRNRYHG